MQTFLDFMGTDHRRCDDLFVEAERKASAGDWSGAEAAFKSFVEATEHHFEMEESVLFPRFEQGSGSSMGPTQVMRMEHVQMRDLFRVMGEALQAQDSDGFLGEAETLLVLMQQHNMKEEQILYPMTDQVLESEREEVLKEMQAL